MSIKLKRNLTYATIAAFYLSTGIGYAIIFPTIWNYIHERYNGKGAMLGAIIAAYSVSSFFSNPLIGLWSDKTHNTKAILIVSVSTEIAGSLMYFFGISTWFLMLSRLVSGFGGGGSAAILADIARTTSKDDLTSVIAMVVSLRQLGLLIGPALNLFLSKINLFIGAFPVDKYTSPGLFMAILWTLVELSVISMYYNLTSLKSEEEIEQLFQGYGRDSSVPYDQVQQSDLDVSFTVDTGWNCTSIRVEAAEDETKLNAEPTTSASSFILKGFNDNKDLLDVQKDQIHTINCRNMLVKSDNTLLYAQLSCAQDKRGTDHRRSTSNTMIETAERFIQSASGSFGNYENLPSSIEQGIADNTTNRDSLTALVIPNTSLCSSLQPSISEETHELLPRVKEGYLRDEVIALLGLAFISSFSQTVLETVLTPLAEKYYNFGEMKNSLIYLFSGIEVLIVFFGIKFFSKRVSDRVLLLFGLAMMSIATGIPMLYVPSAKPGQVTTMPYFVLTIIIDLLGICVIVVCSAALLSKITSDENQALSQGLRRSMVSLGCILGPLWGGAYLKKIYFLFAIPLGVTFLISVLFFCSYKKMRTT